MSLATIIKKTIAAVLPKNDVEQAQGTLEAVYTSLGYNVFRHPSNELWVILHWPKIPEDWPEDKESIKAQANDIGDLALRVALQNGVEPRVLYGPTTVAGGAYIFRVQYEKKR